MAQAPRGRSRCPGSSRSRPALIALHPEYHALLEAPERHLDRDWRPESGDVNPFLHLSLHLAVAEQLAIDQPPGIRAQFERLRAARGDEHAALHAVLECLGEVMWQAQRHGTRARRRALSRVPRAAAVARRAPLKARRGAAQRRVSACARHAAGCERVVRGEIVDVLRRQRAARTRP